MSMKRRKEMFPLCYDLFMNSSAMYSKILEFFVKYLRDMDIVLDVGSGTGNLTLKGVA
ncbi:hypothetical protein BMS3Abin15_01009 [bacterium BMS3Abin15]|nr:hypothetical protein BMS3Abin15_01009 [bacterium BMS3Abin15]